MLKVNFAYPEAQAIIEVLCEAIRGEYNIKSIWRLAKAREKIENNIRQQYDDPAKYHEEGQKEEQEEKRILDLVKTFDKYSMVN